MISHTTISTLDEATRDIIVNVDSGGTSPWMTFALTLFSSVIVFVVSQFLYGKWITPLQKYKEIKQKVAYCLTFYAYCYANPIVFKQGQRLGEEYITASNEIRQVSAELRGFAEIPARIHFGIPKKENLIDASLDLIGLSNGMSASSEDTIDGRVENNYRLVEHIAGLLKLKGYNKTAGKE